MVGRWYSKYYESSNQDLYDFTLSQIKEYEIEAIKGVSLDEVTMLKQEQSLLQ